MSPRQDMVAIGGSVRRQVPGAKLIGKSNPNQVIRVSIYAKSNDKNAAKFSQWFQQLNQELPKKRKYMDDSQCADAYGAEPDARAKIVKWAESCHLKVVPVKDPRTRLVQVEGKISDVEAAFGVQLNDYEHPTKGTYRGREGALYVPAALADVIDGVEGLDTRPVGHRRIRHGRGPGIPTVDAKASKGTGGKNGKGVVLANLSNNTPGVFFPPQIATLYSYPTSFDGTGQNVAIFAFNGASPDPHGGYKLSALTTYYEKVLGGKTPSITDVVVHGAGNNPGPETTASGNNGDSTDEVMLDMCIAGSVVPGAKIFMYFTVFTTQGWVDALHEAVMGTNNISVISISYGNPEDDPEGAWTPMGINLVNQIFEAAAAKGITICCASGDDGSLDDEPSGAHADFPASSPFVLGVGGTSLVANSTSNPTSIKSETVWNELLQGGGAGGGGISSVFSKPSYQDGVNVPPSVNPGHAIGRGVPDVSADADPDTGVAVIHINGEKLDPVGGTSAAAPLWASLIARLNQGLNARCGFINVVLYTKFSKGVLRDITEGNNGAYEAGPGWDACTGLGSPQGTNLLKALSGGSGGAQARARRSK